NLATTKGLGASAVKGARDLTFIGSGKGGGKKGGGGGDPDGGAQGGSDAAGEAKQTERGGEHALEKQAERRAEQGIEHVAERSVERGAGKLFFRVGSKLLVGAGGALAVYFVQEDLREGDYFNATLDVVGAVPGPIGWLAGLTQM